MGTKTVLLFVAKTIEDDQMQNLESSKGCGTSAHVLLELIAIYSKVIEKAVFM